MLSLVSLLTVTATLAALPPDSADLRREELMQALRGGGYTIILRHARTDRTVMEDPANIPAERYKQRNLNDAGVADARLMGVVFKKYQIPFGEIISSPMFRTVETAEYAAGAPTTTMELRYFPATAAQAALVAAAPKAGTNRLLVTHHFVIELHVPGIRPGDIGESEAAVIRRTADGKVELVGKILLADWTALAGTPAASTSASAAAAPASAAPATGGHPAVPGAAYPAAAANHAFGAIPDSPLGRLAISYFDAFNSGDGEKMGAFMEKYFVADVNRTTAVRVESYKKLFDEIGPMHIAGTETSTGAELVVVGQSIKRGHVRLTITPAPDSPGRLASVRFAFQQPGGHP